MDYELPTLIEVILDETGSMDFHGRRQGLIDGYNEFLSEQKAQPGLCLVTMTKFSTSRVRTPYRDMPIEMVPNLSANTFVPSGGTNLRDTIIARIEAVKARIADVEVKPNVLFIVMTDGQDTDSIIGPNIVKGILTEHIEAGWTFVYLGADQNANKIGEELGFPSGNIKSFASAEMRKTMSTLSNATTTYRTERASGTVASTVATMNYFAE